MFFMQINYIFRPNNAGVIPHPSGLYYEEEDSASLRLKLKSPNVTSCLCIYRRHADNIDRPWLASLIRVHVATSVTAVDGGAEAKKSMGFGRTTIIL